ncbi:hypothetical protein LINPERHAP1_LOCUS30203 [Linum perenne]
MGVRPSSPPEFSVFLNFLPRNDFNTISSHSLPSNNNSRQSTARVSATISFPVSLVLSMAGFSPPIVSTSSIPASAFTGFPRCLQN